VQPVPLSQVDITDAFWTPRQEATRTEAIWHCFKKFEETGRASINTNLLEGAAYMLAKRPDKALEEYVDRGIDRLVADFEAQLVSGEASPRRGRVSIDAAVAYYEATGKRKLLDAAIKAADLLVEAYGPDKEAGVEGRIRSGGLVRLYQFTGDEKYLKLSQYFLDQKGRDVDPQGLGSPYPGELEYRQNHKPVIEQREAIGHAVAATSLYTWLTDIAALTGQPEYAEADDAIWEDVVARKMYLTGGVGAIRQHEKFGAAYELPNVSSWHETCASRGNAVWNQNMFLFHRDGKYIDTLERVLYNGFNAGLNLKGDRFFYQNVLTSYGDYERFEWINVPCCPPNFVRLTASIGSTIYAQTPGEIYVNLYVASKAQVKLNENNIQLTQETRYPWDGQVKLTVDPDESKKFALYVRIPGWALNKPVPSDLYTYMDPTPEEPSLSVNGEPVDLRIEKGYVRLQRKWKTGDLVEIDFPMPVHKVLAHEKVRDDRGRMALERGPMVFCAEWPDNGGSALNIVVPDDASLKAEFRPDLLNGVEVITGEVLAIKRGEDGTSVETVPHRLVAIPYYAWANRGMGEMTVWMARTAEEAWIKPVVPDPISRVTSFGGAEKYWTGYADQSDDISAVYDGFDPMSSADASHLYFRVIAPEEKPAWIEYRFKGPTEVSSSQVYFVDDQRFCHLPSSWRIVYKDGDTWKPVANQEPYTVEMDSFNTVTFDPVRTTAVRIEIEPQSILYPGGAAGPPWAVTIDEDTIWRESGVIEWRIH
jgi:DUF1680 family protein